MGEVAAQIKIILRALDLLTHGLRIHIFFVQLKFRDAFLDDLELIVLIVDDEIPVEFHSRPVLAKDAKTGGMKCTHPNPLGNELFDAVTHLLRGLVRERDAEDIKRRDTVLDQIRDPVRENACLPASCPGQDEQRPDQRPGNGLSLRGI